MATATGPAPAVTGRLPRLAVPVVVAVGVLNTALAAAQLLSPAQPAGGHHFTRPSDYLIEPLLAASLPGTACAVILLGRCHRQLGRWCRFRTIAAGPYALGTALFGISAAATAARGVESLDIIQFPGIVIWLMAGLLMAIATVRARSCRSPSASGSRPPFRPAWHWATPARSPWPSCGSPSQPPGQELGPRESARTPGN